MLFRHLAKSTSGSLLGAAEGYVVSLLLHAAVIGAALAPRPVAPPSEDIPDSFTWAKFLIPPDRTTGSREVRERLTFVAVPAPGGLGSVLNDAREPERLQLDLPKGTANDDLADPAAAPPPTPEAPADEVMTVLEVDTAAVRVEGSAAPPYPPSLLEKRIEGTVAVQYVVDTTGRADTASFVVLSTTHADFAKSVKATLPLMRFNPAIMNAQKVRQLVQQQFSFKIDTTQFAQPAGKKKP